MIPVTKPFLPPLGEYHAYLSGIYERNWLTNNGPLVNELELQLKRYLKVPYLLYVSNGTIAIQLAIKALGLKGNIITTPFSYVATTSSIVWEGCNPVFVDIDKDTLTIDPNKIEDAITPKTSAILATHVYGIPCDIEAIQAIADAKGLKVIYDAAHAFGVGYNGQSIFSFGDVSTTSFHATKLFHTIEGGAVFAKDPEVLRRLAYMRNFGHDGPEKFNGVGVNAKNSEFHAAMGLCNLKYIDDILKRREELCNYYDETLKNLEIQKPKIKDLENHNFAYYPIIFPSEEKLLMIVDKLKRKEIFPRRYFYPTLSTLNYVKNAKTPIADNIARRVLCLPLFHTLSNTEIQMIARLMLRVQNYGTL